MRFIRRQTERSINARSQGIDLMILFANKVLKRFTWLIKNLTGIKREKDKLKVKRLRSLVAILSSLGIFVGSKLVIGDLTSSSSSYSS